MRLMIGAIAGAAIGAAVAVGRRQGAAARVRQAVKNPIEEHAPHMHPADIAANVREKLPHQVRNTASRLADSPVGEATRHAGHVIADTAQQAEKRAEKFAKEHTHRASSGHS
jgi:hypothetical protein